MNKFPRIGLRTVKTAVVVFISFALAWLRQGQSNALYIAIAAMLAIQPTMESSKQAGTDRLVGTLTGGIWGIIIFLVNVFVFGKMHILVQYAVMSLATVPLILVALKLKRPSTISISLVVFLVVATTPVGELNPLKYVFSRMLDTTLGFLIGILVNPILIPKEYRNEQN